MDKDSSDVAGLKFTMQVEEDIGAEIEDFIFCSRLGLEDEALQIAEQALWKHLKCFPVFAEVALFLVWNLDMKRLDDLAHKVRKDRIQFAEAEGEFMSTVLQIASGTEEEDWSMALAIQQRRSLDKDPVKVHHFLVKLRYATFHWLARRKFLTALQLFVKGAATETETLIRADLLWEATLVFSSLCEMVNHVRSDNDDIQWIWSNIKHTYQMIQGKLLETKDNDQTAVNLCKLELGLALTDLLLPDVNDHQKWVNFWESFSLEAMLHESDALMQILFRGLPNPSVRGKKWDFLQGAREYFRVYTRMEAKMKQQKQRKSTPQASLSGVGGAAVAVMGITTLNPVLFGMGTAILGGSTIFRKHDIEQAERQKSELAALRRPQRGESSLYPPLSAQPNIRLFGSQVIPV